jgi:tRNA modification GTPase
LRDSRGLFDEGLLTLFEAKSSYTGEDSAEISTHGNPLIVERLIAACVSVGARVANEGEFTRRAFLNGRLDLTRAEAVLQAIDASSTRGLEVARQGLSGELAKWIDGLRERLTHIIAELEARLDYPGEELVDDDEEQLLAGLNSLAIESREAADTFQVGRVLVDGAIVALVGPVNAGKSSLFNRLGGSVRALVSEQPGTTRDVVERRVVLDSVAITLLDTAGERVEAEGLEEAGIVLGRTLTKNADLVVVVVPAHDAASCAGVLEATKGRNRIVVANHMDRPDADKSLGDEMLMTSAVSGAGLSELSSAITEALVGEAHGNAAVIIASSRQRDLLLRVEANVRASIEVLKSFGGVAIAAEELYGALEPLDAIIGRDSRESVLDALFSRFCIGK